MPFDRILSYYKINIDLNTFLFEMRNCFTRNHSNVIFTSQPLWLWGIVITRGGRAVWRAVGLAGGFGGLAGGRSEIQLLLNS